MSQHTGRRRKQSDLPLGRIALVVVATVLVGLLVGLPEPQRSGAPGPLALAPGFRGPRATTTAGSLADGTAYTPKLFLAPAISAGVVTKAGTLRLVLRDGDHAREVRRLPVDEQPQFNAFAVDGHTLVWAETVAPPGSAPRTSLWRTTWPGATKTRQLTTATGEPTFYGGQYDLVVHAGRVYWAAVAGETATHVRSVPLAGGGVTKTRLDGDYTLSSWPWAVSVDGGRGDPVRLVNYDTGQQRRLATTAQETATCGPAWCRVGLFGPDSLQQLDLVRPDGTGRRRIAGSEATPTLVDVALLDRYIALSTDLGRDADGVGLSLYDITTGQTQLIAADVGEVAGSGGLLWWSTGAGKKLVWHVIDLHALS